METDNRKTAKTALQYVAFVRRTSREFVFRFPDAPGCEGTAPTAGDVYEYAKAVLEGWLRAQLDTNALPSWPRMHRTPESGEHRVHIWIAPSLALAVQFRLMRMEKGWSQADVAERVGVSQQQIAKLEDPDGNPTVETISKVSKAFKRHLLVVF